MKVSARNVFKGNISALRPGTVNAEVEIALGGGDALVAIVTMESMKTLELAEGKEVMALVKAPWVMVMTEADGITLSARNTLRGTVKSVENGAVNSEVLISLPGGTEVAAVVTKDAVGELGLRPGVAATAVIKASNVILGVPA
ncbi:transporter [Azoarcus indigens]|uniref:Molybdate transport system regulatory protein n=1 Tax=Azoarcus indigens TaxID=29545 RepID=A0A4R6DH84_9RHOO|nr:TOBE domain-containing protein [Azoarcus indigens]NMG67502.1 transporter [Azoarcus indigens]TDN44086.1 molybdate transport system regulatory protein [Azoarcus indigens]